MTNILDLRDKLNERARDALEYDEAMDVLENILNLDHNSVMVIFNTNGKLQYKVMPASRFVPVI